MSAPISCSKCSQIIGMLDGMELLASDRSDWSRDSKSCNHAEIRKTSTKACFGLTTIKHNYYPETDTSSSWLEYSGSKKKYMVMFACLWHRTSRIHTEKGWLFCSLKLGFYGDGIACFQQNSARV